MSEKKNSLRELQRELHEHYRRCFQCAGGQEWCPEAEMIHREWADKARGIPAHHGEGE